MNVQEILKEFRAFILRGNLIDLAIAVVIGAAFTAVVQAIVKGLITPLIAMIVGKSSVAGLHFTINSAVFGYGAVLDALIYFVAVAAVVFFFVLKPVNVLQARFRTEPDVENPTRACPECLSQIPVAAKRCAFCTAEVAPGSAAL